MSTMVCTASENDTFNIIRTAPLNCSMDLDELLPIERMQLEQEEMFEMMSGDGFPQKEERRVSFGNDSVAFIETIDDMSDEEMNNVWYSRQQLSEFKNNARQLFKSQAKGLPVGPQESTRGMDVYYPARQRSHAKYIYHILEAIYIQNIHPEYVAKLATKWSTKSRERALAMAIQDSYEVACFPIKSAPTKPTVSRKRSANWEIRRA